MPFFAYSSYNWEQITGSSGYWTSSTNNQAQVSDYSGAVLTADVDLTPIGLKEFDIIVDSNGRMLGKVDSVGGTEINKLHSKPILTRPIKTITLLVICIE